MAQYGCNTGMTQVQHGGNTFNRLSLSSRCPTCPTALESGGTAESPENKGSVPLSYYLSIFFAYREKTNNTRARSACIHDTTLTCAGGGFR